MHRVPSSDTAPQLGIDSSVPWDRYVIGCHALARCWRMIGRRAMIEPNRRDVTLDLIDKEHQALVAAGRAVDHAFAWELILSVGTLALCFGWITIDPHLSFAGMVISISQADLLLALSGAISVSFWRSSCLNQFGQRQSRQIAIRYDALGGSDHTDRFGSSTYMYPDFLVISSAVRDKSSLFLLQHLRARPPRRGQGAMLSLLCWLVTSLVWLILYLAVILLPLIVDGFVARYMWQHHAGWYLFAAMLLVLLPIYIAGVWQLAQSGDKDGLRSPVRELMEAFSEWAREMKAARSTPATQKDDATSDPSGDVPRDVADKGGTDAA
jgi:hypothetical protein